MSNVLLADAGVTIPGWRLDKSGWRPDVDVGREDLFVSGAMVVGDLPPRKSTATNQSRELIDAILTSTSTTRFATHEFGAHPVVTQVRRAALSRN